MFFKNLSLVLVVASILLVPGVADARAGMGSSMGSRGMRSYSAPPPTRTAPTVQSLERSVTLPSQPSARPMAPPPMAVPQPGFGQQHPFLTGFMGGLVGAGIGSMLFGHGFGMGGLGFAGGIGLLLQFALIAGLGWLAYSFFRGRREEPVAYAGFAQSRADFGATPSRSHIPSVPLADKNPPPVNLGPDEGVELVDADFKEFERLLIAIQRAWSASDVAALRRIVSPEMLSYFAEQLAANTSKGVVNTVEDVKLEQADLAETWSEGEIDYATVSLRFTAHDYMTSMDDGRLVDGSKSEHIEATETWTFMRQAKGRWLLSAIQQ